MVDNCMQANELSEVIPYPSPSTRYYSYFTPIACHGSEVGSFIMKLQFNSYVLNLGPSLLHIFISKKFFAFTYFHSFSLWL